MNAKVILYLFLAVAGLAGAGLSVAMLISAINFLEWGRVLLYSITLAVCIEMVVLCLWKLEALLKDK